MEQRRGIIGQYCVFPGVQKCIRRKGQAWQESRIERRHGSNNIAGALDSAGSSTVARREAVCMQQRAAARIDYTRPRVRGNHGGSAHTPAHLRVHAMLGHARHMPSPSSHHSPRSAPRQAETVVTDSSTQVRDGETGIEACRAVVRQAGRPVHPHQDELACRPRRAGAPRPLSAPI